MRFSGHLFDFDASEIDPVFLHGGLNLLDNRCIGCRAAIATAVQLQPNNAILEVHDFHVATMRMQIWAHFSQCDLHAHTGGVEVGVIAEPIGR